jgi:hypothetical protein
MQAFAERYDDLVDLLCWAAQAGPDDEARDRYRRLREWFLSSYESARPVLLEYLEPDDEDTRPLCSGPTPRDAFESLFLPEEIDALLHGDAVIDRIIRTRMAVEACRHRLDLIRV